MATIVPAPSSSHTLLRVKQSFHRFTSFHDDRYTIAKFRDYDTYAAATSTLRHTAVIFLTPLPSFLSSLLPTLISLQDLVLGVFQNTGFMLHFFVTLGLVMYGSVHQLRGPNAIALNQISHLNAVWIAVIGAGLLTAIVTWMGYAWRFPVPFIWITALAPYTVTFVLSHVFVLRGKLWKNDSLSRPLLLFLPAYVFQSTQVVIYPAFSAIFMIADTWSQVALTLVFPVVKFFYRWVSRKLLRHLDEDANEVAVSGIEICATIYQSMVMQSAPSAAAVAVLMAIDATQSLVHIIVRMAEPSTIPQATIVPTARRLLFATKEHSNVPHPSLRTVPKHARRVFSVYPLPQPIPETNLGRPSTLSKKNTEQVITQALETMSSAESILLVEYFEVVLPCSCALYSLWASQFDSAIYNPKLRRFYYDHHILYSATRSVASYMALQALSLVMVYVLLKRQFGIQARSLLAFVLERHAWSLQGKLVTWLSLLFQFPVVHYGVDFKFKFEFDHYDIHQKNVAM